MEKSKESNENDDFIRKIRAQFGSENIRIQEYIDIRIAEVEEILQRLFWFIEFHLGEVPIKYRKLHHEKGEYPYFKTKTNFLAADKLSSAFQEMDMPKDPEAYHMAKERMKAFAEEKHKITEWYYELCDENGSIVKEVLNIDEANKWVKEGPVEFHLYDGDNELKRTLSLEEADKWSDLDENNYFIDLELRSYKVRFRRVLKPMSSEASSSTLAVEDLNQLHKTDASSPSLPE